MSFMQLKKNRANNTAYLTKKFNETVKGKTYQQEDGYWQPTLDKAGNGWAIIRFLPAGNDESDPFVQLYSYGFQGPTGQWYIEKSRATLGSDEPDPCNEFVYSLWQAKKEDEAKKFPRKRHFISNILVVSDPEHPENNGKVFLFKYGKQIADKINELFNPAIPTDQSINAFDMWDGANMKLIIGRKDKFPTYESSKFDNPSPVAKNDKDIEAIYNQCRGLKEIISDDKFKSYDDLKKRLDRVLGVTAGTKPLPKMESTSKDRASKELDLPVDETELNALLETINGDANDTEEPF